MSEGGGHSFMSEPERPVIILFMGEREEHAITSFKHFYPSSVHIITSEKFSGKYQGLIEQWSADFGFRQGRVKSITDLFEASSVNSMLRASFECLAEERESSGDSDSRLYIGITGGTTHMAITGSYMAQLVGGTAFYVLRPPEGKPVLPQRDILIFPEMGGMKLALGTMTPDVNYLMSNQSGKVEELIEQTRMNEYYIEMATDTGLMRIEDGKWELTEIGRASFAFSSNTSAWGEVHILLQDMISQNDRDNDDIMHG